MSCLAGGAPARRRLGDSAGPVKRFAAGQAGRRHDGSPNYAVGDTMPRLGSDGRVSDNDTMEDAQKWADELNRRFAKELREKEREGLVWREVPGRGFYAWLAPLRPLEELISD